MPSDFLGPGSLPGLYAICDLPPTADAAAARALAAALLRGGAVALQLRQKGAPAGRLLECARALVDLGRGAGVPVIVNDRLDVALAAGAAGVHLGQDDLPLTVARRVAPGLLVGISTHDLAQARAAAAAGADYLGFGPIFATATKVNPDPVVGLAGLRAACAAVPVPVVAIGGLSAATAGAAVAAGAAAVAVIGAVIGAADVTAAARGVSDACQAAVGRSRGPGADRPRGGRPPGRTRGGGGDGGAGAPRSGRGGGCA